MKMVKNQQTHAKMHSTYYLKPGQTLKNTKASERKMMLLAPQSEINRLIDYTNEEERLAVIAEKEATKLAAIKKATYEMSKTWDNTVENIKKQRDDELLMKRKQNEEERVQFVKDLAMKNATERARIVEEARRLLLYKKPQCRLVNGALITSECFRERDVQLAFQKTLQGLDEARDKEYADVMKKDAEKFREEEQQKVIELLKKNRAYGIELKNQMEENKSDLKRAEVEELAAGKQDLINIERDLRLIKECETEQIMTQKKELKKLVTDAIEDRKLYEEELRRDEEFENRALEIFEKSKNRIEKIKRQKAQEELEEKRRHSEFIAKKCAAVTKSRLAEEEESIRRAQEEREAVELARIEERKKYEAKFRAEKERDRQEAEAATRKEKYEERELINWETLQRFKRDEYNKEWDLKQREREWEKKMKNATSLRWQIEEKRAERNREKLLEDNSALMNEMLEKTNSRVLAYGDQVLEESRGVRPLFPIIRVIEQFKSENGLIPRKTCEETAVVPAARRQRKRRPTCSKPISEKETFYL